MQLTQLRGSRRDIGLAHGRAHAPLIHVGIDVYDRLFQDFVGLDWEQARREAERLGAMIEKRFPAILEEMAGIGEAGMVAKIGMNAHGIGVCLNAIRSRTCGEGLPIHVALRKILESPDPATALTLTLPLR